MRGQIDKVPVMYQNAALDESFMKKRPRGHICYTRSISNKFRKKAGRVWCGGARETL